MLSTPPTQRTTRVEAFDVYGFRFRLRTNVPDARRLIARLYRNFSAPSVVDTALEVVVEQDRDGFLWKLDEHSGTSQDLPSALSNLEAALCETIIRSQQRCIAIHSATIQVENSFAMLAGRSTAGKTTLSLALTRRGFPAAGDDVALLRPETLDVLPIPRCFHLDDRGASLLEADGLEFPASWLRFRFMVPNDFRQPDVSPRRARWLIFLRGPRAEQPVIAPLSQAEMTARLLSETGQGPLEDSETIRVICRLVSEASCFELRPGPLAETADAIVDLLTRPRPAAE
jgi:hypothetical protein